MTCDTLPFGSTLRELHGAREFTMFPGTLLFSPVFSLVYSFRDSITCVYPHIAFICTRTRASVYSLVMDVPAGTSLKAKT